MDIDLDTYIERGMKEQIHIAYVDSPDHYRALFSGIENEKAIGEISNSYMICPSAAQEIFDYNSEMKILVMLRNPISRAWSQYLMNLREAKTKNDDFIRELEMDDANPVKGWGANHQYLELGKYHEQLKRYIELFGRDRVLPIFYEQYRKNTDVLLKEICDFLGIDSSFQFDFSQISNAASMPRNKALNSLLVESGAISRAKKIVPRKFRKHFANVLYSDKKLPEITESEKKMAQVVLQKRSRQPRQFNWRWVI